MQRNVRGGKGYKKGKKAPAAAGGAGGRDRFFERDEGQDYGRVTAMLGDRRVRCFCNDGVERICKIRSRLCKKPHKKIIAVGDIVLISPRDFGGVSDSDSDSDNDSDKGRPAVGGVWDLLDKAERDDWRQIRKEKGIHPQLFSAEAAPTSSAAVDDIFDVDGTAAKPAPAPAPAPAPENASVGSISDDDIDAI